MQGNELRNLYGALGRCRRRMNFADGYATDKVHLLYIKLCDGIAVEIWVTIQPVIMGAVQSGAAARDRAQSAAAPCPPLSRYRLNQRPYMVTG